VDGYLADHQGESSIMKFFRKVIISLLLVLLSLCLFCCEKKKQGEVIITEQEFVLRQEKEHSYVIDAKGKIRNIGEVDVKKVVVTGYCRSCSEVWVVGQWLESVAEKLPEQKDMIGYLAVGEEAEFSFKQIANMYHQDAAPPEMPENMEIVIESFESVN